jgi:hypothetical protein
VLAQAQSYVSITERLLTFHWWWAWQVRATEETCKSLESRLMITAVYGWLLYAVLLVAWIGCTTVDWKPVDEAYDLFSSTPCVTLQSHDSKQYLQRSVHWTPFSMLLCLFSDGAGISPEQHFLCTERFIPQPCSKRNQHASMKSKFGALFKLEVSRQNRNLQALEWS